MLYHPVIPLTYENGATMESLKQPQSESHVITSIATFKDQELEADFNDFIWKDVYGR